MEKMVYEKGTQGGYIVRPESWGSYWRTMPQSSLSRVHLASFAEEKDAKRYVELMNAESEGRLQISPCVLGDVYYRYSDVLEKVLPYDIVNIIYHMDDLSKNTTCYIGVYNEYYGDTLDYTQKAFEKEFFPTREEAERAAMIAEREV